MANTSKQSQNDAKIVVYTRIDPATVAGLDAIRESMPVKPTRAQLIDAALAEYVQRHGSNKSRRHVND